MRRLDATLLAVAAAVISGCTPPPPSAKPTAQTVAAQAPLLRGAYAGRRQHVEFLTSADPDCSYTGPSNYEVVKPPAHGVVAFEPSTDFPQWPAENIRSRCNGRRIPGTTVFYTSAPEFHGTDEFAVVWVSPNGFLSRRDFVITVR